MILMTANIRLEFVILSTATVPRDKEIRLTNGCGTDGEIRVLNTENVGLEM